MSPAQADIRTTNQLFERAVMERDLTLLDAVYTENARILPPGAEAVTGRENIKHFWQAALEGMKVRAVQLQTVEFEASGDFAYEIGHASLQLQSGEPAPAAVKYVVVWKQENGRWKWHVDIWNPNA
jgi:ketosteroid isomerase-like protein